MCVCVSVIRLSWLLSHPCGVTVSGALHHSPRCFRDVLCLYHSFLCVCHNYGMGLPTVRVSPKPEGRLWQNRFPAVCWKYEQSEYRFPAVCWNIFWHFVLKRYRQTTIENIAIKLHFHFNFSRYLESKIVSLYSWAILSSLELWFIRY